MLTFIDRTYVLNDTTKDIIKSETAPFYVLYASVYSSEGTILSAGDSWDSWDDVLGCIQTCWDHDKQATEEYGEEWDSDESLRENVVYVRDIDAFLLIDPEGKIHGAQPANFLRKEN